MAFWSPFLGRNKSEYHRQAAHPVLRSGLMAPFLGDSLNTPLKFQVRGELLFKPAPQMFLYFQSLSSSAPILLPVMVSTSRGHSSAIYSRFPAGSAAGAGLTWLKTWKFFFNTWMMLWPPDASQQQQQHWGGSAGIFSPMEMQHWESQLPANPTVAFWQGWTEKSCSDCP